MKTASPALVSYLANLSSNPQDVTCLIVDLYTIQLNNGTTFRFNNMDQPLTYGGQTYQVNSPSTPDAPVMDRVANDSAIGLEVTTLEFDMFLAPTMQVNGLPMLQAMLLGLFDAAAVLVQRMLMPTWGDTSLGVVTLFSGYIADLQNINRASAHIVVKSWTDILNQMMPRNLNGPACRHSLYDAGCTLNPASFTSSGVVQAGSTFISINTNLTQPGPLAAPASPSTLGGYSPAGSNTPEETYYVVMTYVSAFGETLPGPVAARFVGNKGLLTATAPPSVAGAVGYNVYVGFGYGYNLQSTGAFSTGSQTPYKTAPYAFSYNWLMPAFGWVQGPPPPAQNVTGYFAQGVITFTSGANSGLSYTVQDYQNAGGANGVVTLVRAALATPAPGDTFTIIPGCDKSLVTCINRYNNKPNFAGKPFIPAPEASV